MPNFAIRARDISGIQRELSALIRKHSAARKRRIKAAIKKTAQQTARYVKATTVPQAFKELVHSIHAEGNRVIADAPHAEPVEVGSRPHVPPLAPLIAWVRLRGMQGLKSPSRLKRLAGPTTATQARNVATMIKGLERRNNSTPVDAPTQVAKAIQAAIARHGTKAYRYMLQGVPFAQEALYVNVSAAVPDP